jgi:TolA-binding protein
MRALLISGLLVLSGCFFPADRGHLLETKVDTLASDNMKLRDALKDAQDKLEQTLSRLQEALAQLDTASRTTGANIGVKVDGAIQDVAALRGQIEGYQYKLQELEQKLNAGGGAGASSVEAKKEELKRPDDPKEFLKLAEDKAKSDPSLARSLFMEFLKKWPRDEGAGEAHFGIGEIWFAESPPKCREALYEYNKVIQDHPKSRSTSVAYLRTSDCFKELKMVPEAKMALEELQKQLPKSEAAKTAKTKLAELNKPAPARAPKK